MRSMRIQVLRPRSRFRSRRTPGTDVGGVDTAKVQGPLKEKGFEGVLIEFPAGPTAVTLAS